MRYRTFKYDETQPLTESSAEHCRAVLEFLYCCKRRVPIATVIVAPPGSARRSSLLRLMVELLDTTNMLLIRELITPALLVSVKLIPCIVTDELVTFYHLFGSEFHEALKKLKQDRALFLLGSSTPQGIKEIEEIVPSFRELVMVVNVSPAIPDLPS